MHSHLKWNKLVGEELRFFSNKTSKIVSHTHHNKVQNSLHSSINAAYYEQKVSYNWITLKHHIHEKIMFFKICNICSNNFFLHIIIIYWDIRSHVTHEIGEIFLSPSSFYKFCFDSFFNYWGMEQFRFFF